MFRSKFFVVYITVVRKRQFGARMHESPTMYLRLEQFSGRFARNSVRKIDRQIDRERKREGEEEERENIGHKGTARGYEFLFHR